MAAVGVLGSAVLYIYYILRSIILFHTHIEALCIGVLYSLMNPDTPGFGKACTRFGVRKPEQLKFSSHPPPIWSLEEI
jgi:hypothetical protein